MSGVKFGSIEHKTTYDTTEANKSPKLFRAGIPHIKATTTHSSSLLNNSSRRKT